MLVSIRIKQDLLRRIKLKNQEGLRKMPLGNHIILQDYQDIEIEEVLLESTQCKYWMDIDELKTVETKVETKVEAKEVEVETKVEAKEVEEAQIEMKEEKPRPRNKKKAKKG